jgi:quinol monooxygenase YgiN
MQTQTQTAKQVPAPAAVVITHEVENFDTWKGAFDRHADTRRGAGIITAHVNRHADNPNRVSIYLGATDRAKLSAFIASTDLMATMRAAGVMGPPLVVDVTPVEDLTRKDRALPALIIRHEVRDWAAWKAAFDEHADARAAAGIVGHAVNRSTQNPNVVVVYLQAESEASLRAFTANTDVKQVMQAAGVVGAPDLSFVTGGTWQN